MSLEGAVNGRIYVVNDDSYILDMTRSRDGESRGQADLSSSKGKDESKPRSSRSNHSSGIRQAGYEDQSDAVSERDRNRKKRSSSNTRAPDAKNSETTRRSNSNNRTANKEPSRTSRQQPTDDPVTNSSRETRKTRPGSGNSDKQRSLPSNGSVAGSVVGNPRDNELFGRHAERNGSIPRLKVAHANGKDKPKDDAKIKTTSLSQLEATLETGPRLKQDDSGLRFRDGLRRIDFILVYEEIIDKKEKEGDKKFARWREKFLRNLKKSGLHLEEEATENEKKLITFIKLHAPWEVCCAYAEDLSIRAPLQAHPNPSSNGSGRVLDMLHIPNLMDHKVPNTPLDYYTCQFKKSKLERFLGSNDHENFFEDTHRHRILWEILSTTTYGKKKRAEIGIERLMDEGGFVAAYPLHDGKYKAKGLGLEPEQYNKRQVLYHYWARWGTWCKYQPLDHIREYFGEKIGIYFAWLGFYTAWLLPASVVGVLVFLFGLATINKNIPAREACDSEKTFKMCPLCDENVGCEYWYLSDVCFFIRFSYLFDHPGTVFYAIFMSFWAVSFLEYWKRKNASLAHHWDCSDFEEEEERPRPDYAARAPEIKENPITGINEPYFDPKHRLPRILSGIAAIVIMICLVLIFIIAVIMYRVLISIPLFENSDLRSRASSIASMSAAVVNLVIIMTLGRVYEKLALKLTQWEMHRTQTEFEDQLTFKVFIFQFVNFYSSIIYVGFFKGKFVGYPGHYNRLFGLRMEECNNGGCLIELAQQLGVIMIGKQIINNAQEIIIPKLKGFIHRWKVRLEKNVNLPRWEEDFALIENEGLFQEYLEMVLQFGFITIFVAAFPLAPLFALLNNYVEIRLDAHKFVCETRRPVAERAQDIGVWFTILEALGKLSVISNAFLIAFTSEFLPRLIYQYEYNWDLHGYTNFTLATAPLNTTREECRYRDFRDDQGDHLLFYWKLLAVRLAFVIVFEHIVFGICHLIDIMVPDVPETLELKIKRERYLAKQALADTDTIMMMAKRNDDDDEMDNGGQGGMSKI